MAKDEGVITMCVLSGLFIIGRLVGGNKLIKPRAVSLFEKQATDKMGKPLSHPDGSPIMMPMIQMSPLPCNPEAVHASRLDISYPVPVDDVKTLELYHRVTAPIPKSVIVTPEGHPELN